VTWPLNAAIGFAAMGYLQQRLRSAGFGTKESSRAISLNTSVYTSGDGNLARFVGREKCLSLNFAGVGGPFTERRCNELL
jgi:hypothetical protein